MIHFEISNHKKMKYEQYCILVKCLFSNGFSDILRYVFKYRITLGATTALRFDEYSKLNGNKNCGDRLLFPNGLPRLAVELRNKES